MQIEDVVGAKRAARYGQLLLDALQAFYEQLPSGPDAMQGSFVSPKESKERMANQSPRPTSTGGKRHASKRKPDRQPPEKQLRKSRGLQLLLEAPMIGAANDVQYSRIM